jgi:hypothetical protein
MAVADQPQDAIGRCGAQHLAHGFVINRSGFHAVSLKRPVPS